MWDFTRHEGANESMDVQREMDVFSDGTTFISMKIVHWVQTPPKNFRLCQASTLLGP